MRQQPEEDVVGLLHEGLEVAGDELVGGLRDHQFAGRLLAVDLLGQLGNGQKGLSLWQAQ